MNSNHLLSEPPLLQNKTFLRSILRDPDLKRRTMHACKHGVCRHRHTNTYTHACTHTHTHIHTRAYIATEGRNILPRRTHFCLASKPRKHEKKRKERWKGKGFSESIDFSTDRSIDSSYRAKYRALFVLTNRLLSFFSILRRWKIQSL